MNAMKIVQRYTQGQEYGVLKKGLSLQPGRGELNYWR